MRVAIIVSVVVHAVLIAFAPVDSKSPVPSIVSDLDPEPPATVEPDPITVAYLDDAQLATLAAHASSRSATLPPRAANPRARGPRSDTPTAPEASVPARSSLLPMREPGAPEPSVTLGVSPRFVDDFLRRSKPVEVPDLPGARIDAQIAEIRARMHDRRGDAGYDPTGDREALVGLREQRSRVELVAQKDGTYTSDKTTFNARVARDGTVKITDKPNLQREGLGARFDVTDAVMRSHGMDPYASAKLRFLDRTRDQRVAIGEAYRREVLSHSAELMRANLERVWRVHATTAARKQAVFALWDEVAEHGGPALVAGGEQARALLLRFVHVHLTGRDRYTPDELAALNAKRTSSAMFAP